MRTKIEDREKLKQNENQKSTNVDYSLMGLPVQSESEIRWIKLHQMFDK